jgi:hypothetical protein
MNPGDLVRINFLGGFKKEGLVLSCNLKVTYLGEKEVVTLLDGWKVSEVVLHPRDTVEWLMKVSP